jgi:hypothetical protein
MAIIQNFGLDNVIEFERGRRQPRCIRATDKDLHGMIADFPANLANLSLCNNVAACRYQKLGWPTHQRNKPCPAA